MKLKKPLKGTTDIKRGPMKLSNAERSQMLPHQREVFEKFAQKHNDEQARRHAAVTPEQCNAAGIGYNGPAMPDKGKKNGSCNRSACQMPLAGQPQFWMKDYMVHEGRLYYCRRCERMFTEADRQFREPLRCTPDEDNAALTPTWTR